MQSTIFDALLEAPRPGSSGRTSPEFSASPTTLSAPSWADWSAATPPSSRREGEDGPTLAWFMDPGDAPHGAYWTPSTSAWRNDGGASSCSLAEVLETGPLPTRFFLSAKACAGILRRAEKRGKDLPPSPAARTQVGGGLGTDAELDGALIPEIANPLTARMHKGVNTTADEGQTMIAHSLRAEGFDASEDGTGRGTPLVPVAFHPTQDPISSTDGTTHAMGTGSKGGVATVAVASAMQVRRLTPRECERLQGFPDDWTAIPWRGKPASECPDGPRYKALGNSMAVPCMRYLGERIAEVSS